MTTDIDHLDLQPVRGWWLQVDTAGTVTLLWPHHRPLLRDVPLDVPPGWALLVTKHDLVVVFVGYGLGLRVELGGAPEPPTSLREVAEAGALAAGAVRRRRSPGMA